MGLRGMAVGGLLGGGLGGVAGILSLLIMRASGTSMEEVRYWQYKWRANRDANISAAAKVKYVFFFTIEIEKYLKLSSTL